MQNKRIDTHEIVFFLVPGFSMIAFSSAIEPLRLANLYLPEFAYHWHVISADGNPVAASNGVSVNVDGSLFEIREGHVGSKSPELILVTSGIGVNKFSNPKLNSWLRKMSESGTNIAGLCTGAWVLAEAGLLTDKRCAIHWDSLPGFSEAFPEINACTDLYETSGNIFSCAGGTATLDLMLFIIDQHFGAELVNHVCEQVFVDRTRAPTDRQRMPRRLRTGVHNTKLLLVIELMEANISEPLALAELSQYSGLSRRQVERLFRKHLARSPARYYLDMRLERAHQFLQDSELLVIEIGIACGFTSASHFSRCYRELYGCSPYSSRKDALIPDMV